MRRSEQWQQSPLVLFSVGLTNHQKAELNALSARTRLSWSVFIRAAVDLALAKPDMAVRESEWDPDVRRFTIFTARVTPDQRGALAVAARRRKLSRAALTRAGLDLILKNPALIAQVSP